MKLITAIIKPFKLDDVKDALKGAGVTGMTRHRGAGLRSPVGSHRGVPGCGVHDRRSCRRCASRSCATTPTSTASPRSSRRRPRTGKIGDGKLWVVDVNRALRLRTGERDTDAI